MFARISPVPMESPPVLYDQKLFWMPQQNRIQCHPLWPGVQWLYCYCYSYNQISDMHHIDIQLTHKSPPCSNKFKISISSYKKNMKISKTKATGIQDPDMLQFTQNIKETKEGFLSHRFSSIGIEPLPLPRCNQFMESTQRLPQSQNLQKSWSGNKKSQKSKKKPKVKQSLEKQAPRVNVVEYGPGDTLRDRYRLEQLIGKGSFGDVYVATDLQSSQKVSVKLVANLKKFQNFVEQEIRFLNQLSKKEEYGRFIVQIKDSFKVDNIYVQLV